MPFEWAQSLKKVQELLSPPPTPGGSPSLPPLCRTSSLPHLICPQTNSGPLSPDLPPPSGPEMMSIGRKSRGSRLTLQYFNRGWTTKMMASASAHLGMRRTGSASPTSQFPLMTGQSDLPASSSSSMMEGLLGSIAEQRERRRRKLSNCMLPLITPLTNPWSHYPLGSIAVSGATK